ncbi:MAG: DUF6883 domain-containing protein [Planctomycetota bacterium]|jgi:hypothetical protein
MKFRDGESAVVDIAKLRLYCLDPKHPRGACKALQFAARLGYTASDAETLREQLLDAARKSYTASDAETLQDQLLDAARKSEEAVVGARDEYGQRYDLDVKITGPDGSGTVRSTWIVRADESPPRLITCYVL